MSKQSRKKQSEIMLMRVIRSAEILFKEHEKPLANTTAQDKPIFAQKTQK